MNENLHNYLGRQVKKYLDDDLVAQNPSLQNFIQIINQSYLNYEKDATLFEKSIKLNDIEYNRINAKLKVELEQKKDVQKKLFNTIKQLESSNHVVIEDNNSSDYLFKILTDEIEFKKRHQEELYIAKINAEKANEAKSDFLSIMSHEIRTPLNAIIGLTYIIENEKDIVNIHENIFFLKKSAQHLHQLINNILDFGKIENGKVDLENISFDYKTLVIDITKSLESMIRENNNKITVYFDDEFCAEIISDPLRISQIINNLLSNAIKFTKNGLIEIRVKTLNKSQNNIVFKTEIIDNGIGIDLDKFDAIFEKFSQLDSSTSRKYGGSGLGLVITKNLLKLFNSEIHITSEANKGCNFSFILDLPLNVNQLDNYSSNLEKDVQIHMLDGMKVLLVEDNLINIKVAEKILHHWNIVLDVAQNGLIGLEKFYANTYDLILMDLSMPVMDGYEASAKIRIVNSTIPIIALTATTSYLCLEKALQIGVNEYVIKPFIPKDLNQKLFKYYKKIQ
ncbi:ATP-binding protein [Flavobacterium sp.]|uniref:ATP-binding protein n=1 Tax=Flavobacterium sp. TaxID=239 RepID=UPI0024870548|nr:ATP-binding protein [Flavobacterium sp.]MDI1317934.1 ATP-binding protein [Flavobacterium sp.]